MESVKREENTEEKPAESLKRKQSVETKRSLQARKSVASVFLQPHLSITNRLGRHLQVDKYTSEGALLTDEDLKKAAKKKKAQECKLFCCNCKNHTCMEKSACAWITIFSLLIIIWVLQLGFIVLFGKVFTTIEGNDWLTQKRISSNFDDSAPFLMDVEAIKKNVKHGWAGGALEFPYKFGSQLFFPGVHPLSRSDVEEEKDKEGSGKADFKFEISEDGNPTDEWKKTQEAAYSKYFTKYYKTPDKEIPGCHEKFRSLDGEDLACKWPIKPSTKENSFAASHCERKNGTPVKDENGKLKCFPILYFTINQLIGWIPQKNAADEKYGQIHCELDLEDDIINKGKKTRRFQRQWQLPRLVRRSVWFQFCEISVHRTLQGPVSDNQIFHNENAKWEV